MKRQRCQISSGQIPHKALEVCDDCEGGGCEQGERSHHEDRASLRLVNARAHILSMSAKLAARTRRCNTVDDCFSMDKQQTYADEQSKEVMASDRFRLVEAVMLECEKYLKDHTGFEGFILWALVDNSGRFEQPGRMAESGSIERNGEYMHESV